MGGFVKGDVVVIPFPFSDLSDTKKRPALVVASLTGDDVILCQITTQVHADSYSIALSRQDFETGNLHHDSYIRPNHLFTAEESIIVKQAGRVKSKKMELVVDRIIGIITK